MRLVKFDCPIFTALNSLKPLSERVLGLRICSISRAFSLKYGGIDSVQMRAKRLNRKLTSWRARAHTFINLPILETYV